MAADEKKAPSYKLNKKAKKNSVVHYGRLGGKIDLDNATQEQLKFLFDKGHPWISKV